MTLPLLWQNNLCVGLYPLLILLISFFVSLFFHYILITYYRAFFASQVRNLVPEKHQLKNGTPTMGGIAIIACVIITLGYFAFFSPYIRLFLFCLAGFGFIGGWDDWCKIKYKKGISARLKFTLQLFVACIIVLYLYVHSFSFTIQIPFFQHIFFDAQLLFIPWALFILIGTSNAVNLTDGLDGLAINSVILNFLAYVGFILFNKQVFCALTSDQLISLLYVSLAFVGTSLGFLWFNIYPAQIIMGDVGALSLGSCLGLMALITKQELLLALTGILFVVETLSSILQVLSFKLTKKRIFKMAPIHHHFELIGWHETTITGRFTLITFIVCACVLLLCIFW